MLGMSPVKGVNSGVVLVVAPVEMCDNALSVVHISTGVRQRTAAKAATGSVGNASFLASLASDSALK